MASPVTPNPYVSATVGSPMASSDDKPQVARRDVWIDAAIGMGVVVAIVLVRALTG